MLRITLLGFLWIYGLTPTAISLLIVIAMAGRPAPCDAFSARGFANGGSQSDHRTHCTEQTYGWELLVLPLATASPFISGFILARMSADRKEHYLRATRGSSGET
jgi:hypothetical protein